jgi:hypothetical protein
MDSLLKTGTTTEMEWFGPRPVSIAFFMANVVSFVTLKRSGEDRMNRIYRMKQKRR